MTELNGTPSSFVILLKVDGSKMIVPPDPWPRTGVGSKQPPSDPGQRFVMSSFSILMKSVPLCRESSICLQVADFARQLSTNGCASFSTSIVSGANP